MKPIYTAEVTSQNGRNGNVKSQDGNLNLKLAIPEQMGGDGSAGSNPEQLFAAAFGASFLSTFETLATEENVELKNPKIIVKVSVHEGEDGYYLSAALNIVEEGLHEDLLADLVKRANHRCPYAKAFKDSMEIILTVNKIEITL